MTLYIAAIAAQTVQKEESMATKDNPGRFDCYAHAESDEPMFVLLARDLSAPVLVEQWANQRERAIHAGQKPASDMEMVEEARKCAQDMRAWRARRR